MGQSEIRQFNAETPPEADFEAEGDDLGPFTGPKEDPTDQIVEHRVRPRSAGKRLDKYLHGLHPRISRTILQRYIKQGLVTVNGLPTKASYEPVDQDVVRIVLPPPPPSEVIPEDIPLQILYEDEWILVINKSAGIVCHPAHAAQSGTVANAVAFHAHSLSHGEDPFRPGIVHRLDKNTTGVMLIAKTDEAHWRVSLQFERRTVRKEYFAISEGVVSLDGDVINKPLAPHPETTQRMILPNGEAGLGRAISGAMPPRQAMFKEAITEYRVQARYRCSTGESGLKRAAHGIRGYTAVELFPRTGRTHQLRVHLASIGHPIVGDTLYGGRKISELDLTGTGSAEPLIEHQALHARRLALMHPILEKPIAFEAPLPANMRRIMDLLEPLRVKQDLT